MQIAFDLITLPINPCPSCMALPSDNIEPTIEEISKLITINITPGEMPLCLTI